MSPRGYYQREHISPHFTTNAYKQSEEGKHEAAMEKAVEEWLKGLITIPRKLIKKVWIWLLFATGYLKDIDKNPYI